MHFPARFESGGEEETRAVARDLAAELRAGDVVALSGPLGSGKTVFVRGLAEGLGGEARAVASPTFAILHEYDCARAAFVHLDLYRIADEEKELREIGLPDVLAGKIAAVEWPNRSAARLLRFRYRVSIEGPAAARRTIRIDREDA
ncbi:MAG TPA: tRNA (adenosine(37)-N6)-threonylcarbamoyltransferase complex ATPase subunit type 1 TsaE [Thermoanaerobaculia bacterium]|nr:tRNA (adenosine(37)-N6)-threonylcarbamoyltransferase complex ATPase subunit type 1 TsaE [Thermoanaerobaculia bacterium]